MRPSRVWAVVVLVVVTGCATQPRLTTQSRRLLQLRTALGVGYMRQGEMGLARHELALALMMDRNNASANDAMALVEERLHERKKARYYFQRGLAHHPTNGALQNNYGAFLCSGGKVDKALQHFKAALASPLYPTPQLADLNAGICLLRTPHLHQAISYLHRAQALAPVLPGPFFYLAQIRLKQHYLSEARQDIRSYLHLQRTAAGLALGVRIGRAIHDDRLIHYCVNRLIDDFAHTPQTRWVENLQREGKLFGQ
ncbi:MAG: type IV pilus biogenesis/stability protein PilW [Acidiferrobacter sp.]